MHQPKPFIPCHAWRISQFVKRFRQYSTVRIYVSEGRHGFHEVDVNTMEGFWSLLRFWLRPHRGISQVKLPLYLSFFECPHNLRRRGKTALAGLYEEAGDKKQQRNWKNRSPNGTDFSFSDVGQLGDRALSG
ncbi:hypothetical protein [Endozoicomonas euniceicola]|uniref:Transposase n=1 Tax=Endozoicomonas euniceicola TaxID=1234143 RepID=A0ABY6GQR9_9GAMM|nr:hypothetical protein [Endozoicomonas euniceicola]UYM15093.1 hypothetical protein NX720_19810 [Endozoicomonas euniceicola]